MKNRKAKKLTLHRETLLTLEDSNLKLVNGGNLSVPVCTRAISDCVSCTKRLDSCPQEPPTTGTIA
ncbi:MAG TPA: class I lanthipeptide [Thermoanaerobaculia bacterium]|nr:class I lanthipeptide [Thermoanaerobaculia bacterium]